MHQDTGTSCASLALNNAADTESPAEETAEDQQ